MEALNDLEPYWTWLAIGLILGVAEMAIPGVFLIWMAAAALIVGVLAFLLPIGVPLQIVIFALLAILAVFIGRRYLSSHPVHDADPLMNRRTARLVGETAVVTVAIEGGRGRIRVGDGEWIAKGPDMAAGTRVRIAGGEGAMLVVEPVEQSGVLNS